MFITTTPDGYAYHDTNGMPCIHWSLDAAMKAARVDAIIKSSLDHSTDPLTLEDYFFFELNQAEARHIAEQAHMAVYGTGANT